MLEDLKKEATERMTKCVAALKLEFKRMRTGRASTALLEHVKVDYYGTDTPLAQIANVIVEDARTLAVTPWDKSMVPIIERAIHKSDLGLTPNTAGAVIRLPMPPLTEERRRDLVKAAKQDTENARVAVRNVRRDVMNELKDMLKEKLITQDDEKRAHDEVQKLTDRFIAELDGVFAEKEKDLLHV